MTVPKSHLEDISTHWTAVRDPNQFVLRYAPAIRAYMTALLGNVTEADDAAQEFYVTGLRKGFVRQLAINGRFRDYLKAAIRNAAWSWRRRVTPTTALPDELGTTDEHEAAWTAAWCRCALDRA